MNKTDVTMEEALAYNAYYEAQRHTEKVFSLRLSKPFTAEVVDNKGIAVSKKAKDTALFWRFDEDFTYSVRIDGNEIHTDIDSSAFLERYAAVVNCEGKFALVDIIEKIVILPPIYSYISIKFYQYAEVVSNIPDSDDFREHICDGLFCLKSHNFVDIPKGKYLRNSLGYDSFQVIEDGLVYLCSLHDDKAKCVSRGYNEIMMNHSGLLPVQDAESCLWGWIDKSGKEILPCKYHNFNFFNDGYTVLKDESGKPFVGH